MRGLRYIDLLVTLATKQNLQSIKLWLKGNVENFKKFDYSPMMFAAGQGNVEVMEWLKNEGCNPEICCTLENFYGRDAHDAIKPLHIAVLNGHSAAVIWLYNNLVDINARTATGNTAMHFAAKAGDLFMIKLLKACNSHIDCSNETGATPLHFAVERGCLDIVRYLVAQEADPKHQNLFGEKLCHIAVSNGHAHIVNWLIKQKLETDSLNYDEETPLHYAAKSGDKDIIRALIANKANLDSRDVDGMTPLHWAVEYGHLDVVKILHQHEADLCVKNYKGTTLVHIAAQHGHLGIIQWFENQNLKIDLLDSDKDSPVHYAARNGHIKVIEYFYNKGYDINDLNNDNATPCCLAVIEGHLNVVKYFYKKDIIKINEPDSNGSYLAHIIADAGHLSLMKWLIKKGFDINVQDADGNTPLHLAISSKETEMIKLLKDKEADLNIKNKFDKSPLIWSLMHYIEGSLFCSPEAVLDLSDKCLYDYLIKNIDHILFQSTLRDKILGGINILKSFEDLSYRDDAKQFTQNLSKKLGKIIEEEIINLSKDVLIQSDVFKISGYQEQLQNLDNILSAAIELKVNSPSLLNVLNYSRIKICSISSRIQQIKESFSSNDINNVQNENILPSSQKPKNLFEDCSQDHRPRKIQKTCDETFANIGNSDNDIMEECEINPDKVSDNFLLLIGEINSNP